MKYGHYGDVTCDKYGHGECYFISNILLTDFEGGDGKSSEVSMALKLISASRRCAHLVMGGHQQQQADTLVQLNNFLAVYSMLLRILSGNMVTNHGLDVVVTFDIVVIANIATGSYYF